MWARLQTGRWCRFFEQDNVARGKQERSNVSIIGCVRFIFFEVLRKKRDIPTLVFEEAVFRWSRNIFAICILHSLPASHMGRLFVRAPCSSPVIVLRLTGEET